MKKIFLIPLLTLLCTVMAWGVDVNDAASFKAAWEDPSTTSIRLTNPITVSEEMVAAGNFTVDFNGNTITAGDYKLCVGGNYDDKKLYDNVVTFTGEGGITADKGCLDVYSKVVINGGNFEAKKQFGIYMNGAAELEMNGGSITAPQIALSLSGTATITGGSITATASSTRAISMQTNSHLEISGGSINAAAACGIKVTQGCELTFSDDGEIVANDGINIVGGTLTVNNGSIITDHNGISITSGTLTVNDGSITGHNGIYMTGGTLTINDGTITGDNGIYMTGGTLTINDGTISGAISGDNGIQQKGGIATINGGTIYDIFIVNTSELNIHGGTILGYQMAISGNGSDGGTTINIDGGTIGSESTGYAIYHPQVGVLNIEGGDFIGKASPIEIRAGELNISGNPTFTSVATKYSCNPNGNGVTSEGAALAIAQHTTKQPIAVAISGGTFRAIYPIAQSNPQENAAEYVNLLDLTVTGGKFWATNTANVAAYSQNDKLKFKGGYYNLAPHAFVADGYMTISNPDAAPAPTAAEGYLFKVDEYVEDPKTTITDGNWVEENTWESEEVPTEVTAVTIPADGEVFIQPTGTDEEVVAYASSLDLEAGATLTIKDGATLVLGKNAVVDASANLVVEEGGQLLIAPTATPVQPVGSVTLVADGAGLKEGKSDHTDPANLYWQHFAIPTVGAPTSIALSYPNGTPITEAITYYNTWDIVNGWESIVKTDLTEPFVGYNFSNIKDYGTNVNYTFTGQLVGNASSPLNFTRRGFNFFGNSYLAPINIQALQSSMYEQGLEFTVYIFTKQGKRQTYRAINEVTASIYGIDEIKPLQGFFMFAEKATEADFQYNSAVYSAFINKQNGGSNNAPARRAASQYDAKAIIGIESAEGEYDEVVLVASNDFSDEYDLKADARKMENAGMNIYADGSFDYLAVMATNDLMGQTLSFKAGNEAQYTMTFSGIEGELALRDNATGAIIAMEEGASYEFAAQPNSTIEGRFEIVGRNNAPTAIDNTEVKANVKGIYTLTGQYVGEDFKALPAGVYVVNGVKIVK